MNTIPEIKQHNIKLAKEISTVRKTLKKDGQNGRIAYKLYELTTKYRTWHIAYCMLRGTPYDIIESKVRVITVWGENVVGPDWRKINEIIKAYNYENVCIGT